MSELDIRRFVDVNIVQRQNSSVKSTRDTAVLISSQGSSGQDNVFSSLKEWTTHVGASTSSYTNTTKYVEMFFNNGGNKLRVIEAIASTQQAITNAIDNLENEMIVVCAVEQAANLKAIAIARETDNSIYGVNQKILLVRSTTVDSSEVKNFGVKVSAQMGAEMTIAAYLTNIDFDGIDTVKDYAFTKENITAETSDDDVLEQVLENNNNVDMNLAQATRNLGGNLTDGQDIVNTFTLIVLHQTLTERLLQLLTQKIKGAKGLSAISTVMSQELARYVTNGYLTTDKIWNYDTLTVDYNNATYTIIEKDTPLLLGYQVVVLPLNSLSETDKTARKTPPIYVVLATSYGIRAIKVDGETF